MAWHDSEGRNCYGVAEASACSGQPFHGLSANTACCACGGGLRVATSFGYYTEPILVGDSRVVGHPLPRTAERYSVDSTCQLLKFNLTLDGTTGELKLAPHCSTFGCGGAQGDFSVTCTITAHEGELSTSAMLRAAIRVDFDELTGLATAWGYGIFHLDIQTGSLQISPEANLSAIFDDVLLDQSRAAVRLSCTVLGHYEWQVGVPVAPIKGEIEILVELCQSCVNLTAETFVWRYGGVFCPVALGEAKGGRLSWVYQKQNMATVEDIIYLQASETDPSVRCGAGGLFCRAAFVGDLATFTVFRQGEAQLKVSQATDDVGKNLCLILVPQHCEAPRLLSNAQAEADEEGLLAEAVMIDDPSTSIPNDYSLHPCDCFPVSWGVHSPVTSQSFASVVPGSGNQFTPDLVYLLEGSYMCPQAGYLTHMSAGQACHRANPEKCWSFSKRREFLGAGTGSDRQLATSSECLFQSLLEECDLMQLIGGLGGDDVPREGVMTDEPSRNHWRDTWTQKRRLPETLRGGARLSFTCWAERYRAVPEEPGVPSDPYVAQCAGKHWWGEPFSEPGLHFACGACANPLMLTVNGKLFDVTWETPPEPQLMRNGEAVLLGQRSEPRRGSGRSAPTGSTPRRNRRRLELQSRGAVLRHKGGTGGCLHWIDGKVILSPSCQLWCPRTSVSGCVAREDHVFLCVGAIACLDWQNSTWTVREVPDSPSCPISFQRSTAFAAGPDEASALLQLRHGGMERIAACSEAWQWPPQPLLARFSPQSAGASQHANAPWSMRNAWCFASAKLMLNPQRGGLQPSLFESLMAQRLAQGLWVIGDFSDSLPEVKAEQEGSFFSMLYYKNCLNYAVNNFSFSDPYVWWESEKKAHYPSYYLGCGLSSTKNATKFEPPDHFVDPTPELEAWGVPIVHFMHGARCVDAARSWWSFGEVKLSLKDCEEMNGQQAFLWAPGQVALTIAKYPFGRNCLYFSLSDQEVQVGKCDWLSKNNVPLKWSEDLMAFWAGEYCWQASGELEMVKCKDLPLAGGGIARQELPWFAMNCPAGSLITSVQTRFLELTVHYRWCLWTVPSSMVLVLGAHVDDLIGAGAPGEDGADGILKQLQQTFDSGACADSRKEKVLEYGGKQITIDDNVIKLNQQKFTQAATATSVPKWRSATPNAELFPQEMTELRSLGGCLCWLTGQSRPDLAAGTSLYMSGKPTVSNLSDLSKLVREAKASEDWGIQFKAIDLEKAKMVADSSWANAAELKS
eukprot:g1177.t1